MCGIGGFNWEDRKLGKAMNEALAHRGPDDDGIFVDKGLTLAHRRLSILDLRRKAKQPMTDKKGNYIIFNGEIYNFKDIREEIIKEQKKRRIKYEFFSGTDTEVILRAYALWGVDCLKKFNGMFAFCIYDSKKKTLFLARDRLGIKPLHYYASKEVFIFSSEIKGVLEHSIKRKVCEPALQEYLRYGFVLGEHTMFANIKKLMPGHYLLYDMKKKKLSTKKYWKADFTKKNDWPEHAVTRNIKRLLYTSVKRRLIADVPVGAFLSGGVDSSIIVSEIAKHKDNLHTFSVDFDCKGFSEASFAGIVAEQFRTQHHAVQFDAEKVLKSIETLSYHFDEPFADSSLIPMYFVSGVARKHVKVCLSGDGGDENFGGYDRYKWMKILALQKKVPEKMNDFIIKIIDNINALKKTHLLTKGNQLLKLHNKPSSEIYEHIMRAELSREEPQNTTYDNHFIHDNLIDNVTSADLQVYLPDDILTKIDRASMAVSLEARVPFLDHKLVDFMNTVSADLKVKQFTTKYLLKKAYKDILPKKILFRKKQGFGVPLKHYFRDGLKAFIHGQLADRDFLKQGWVEKHYVDKLLKNHSAKTNDHSPTLYQLLQLKRWKETWLT